MKKHLLFLCYLIALNVTSSFAQDIFHAKSIVLDEDKRAHLSKVFNKYEAFSFDISSLNTKATKENKTLKIVLRLGERELKITLKPNEIRAANYTTSSNGVNDAKNSTTCVTYAGYVDDNNKNDVRLLVTEDKIRGYIIQNGKATFITQLYNFDGIISSKNTLLTYTSEDVVDKNIFCGVDNSQEQQFLQLEVQNKTISSTTNIIIVDFWNLPLT